jgi:hypothetical protein
MDIILFYTNTHAIWTTAGAIHLLTVTSTTYLQHTEVSNTWTPWYTSDVATTPGEYTPLNTNCDREAQTDTYVFKTVVNLYRDNVCTIIYIARRPNVVQKYVHAIL